MSDPDYTTAVERPASLSEAQEVRLDPGFQVGGLTVDRYVSQGGFASVYLATTASGDKVALKVMHPDRAASVECVARFEREAMTIRELRHPNIVEIIELGTLDDGRPYIIMEWLEGLTLKDELTSRGAFTAGDAAAILSDLASALSAAHAAGIIHRDVKATNVMLVPKGDWYTVKLLDFGIAKLMFEDPIHQLTRTGMRVGTPATMAPEQLLCQTVDARTDVYGAGLLLFQLITGALPFSGETWIEYEQLHIYAPRPRPSTVSTARPALDHVILRSLEPRPEDRYPSIAEFAAAAISAAGSTDEVVTLAIHLELSFADIDPTDADLDAADDALLAASEAFRDRGMTVAVELAESLLVTAPLPADRSARSKLESLLVTAALEVARGLDDHPRLIGSVRISRSSEDDATSLGDPRTWTLPSRVGWVTAERELFANLLETISEEPSASDPSVVHVRRLG